MSEKIDVVVVGNIVRETIFLDDKIVGPVLGSPCAYASLAIAKAGTNVGVVTHCGDEMQEVISKELRMVDLTGCVPYLYTTENHLIYSDGEHNSVEYFKVAPVINFDVMPNDYLKASVFFICPMDFEVSIDIPKKLKQMGKCVIVDIGGFGGTTSYNHFHIGTNRGKKLINDLCQNSFIIKASFDDLNYIMPDMSIDECLDYLVSRGPRYAIVTMGAKGAAFKEVGKPVVFSDSFPTAQQVEKNLTGAGDAFSAGLIVSMFKNPEDIAYAVKYANSMASLVLEERGGCTENRMPVDRMVKLRMEGKL